MPCGTPTSCCPSAPASWPLPCWSLWGFTSILLGGTWVLLCGPGPPRGVWPWGGLSPCPGPWGPSKDQPRSDPEGLHWCILPDLKDTSMKRSQKADKRARSPPPRGAEAGRAVDAGPLTCVCGEDYIGCRQALQHGCLLPVLQLLPQQLDFISKITLLSLILGLSVFRLQRKGKIIILTRLCF